MHARDIGFNTSKHQMASYMTQTNTRVDNIVKLIENNHKQIVQTGAFTLREVKWYEKFFSTLFLMVARENQLATVVHSQSQSLLSGIFQLLKVVCPLMLFHYTHY